MRMILAPHYGASVTTWIPDVIIQYLKNLQKKKRVKPFPASVSTVQEKQKSMTTSTATGRISLWQQMPRSNQLTGSGRSSDLGHFFLRLLSNLKARFTEKRPW